jgi:hypothetical protein
MDVLNYAHKGRNPSYMHRGYSGNKCGYEGLWWEICATVAQNLGGHPASLTSLSTVFSSEVAKKCYVCKDELEFWGTRVQQLVDEIPKFSSLL